MLALNPRSGDYSGASLEMRFIAFLHLLIVFIIGGCCFRYLLFAILLAKLLLFFDICKCSGKIRSTKCYFRGFGY